MKFSWCTLWLALAGLLGTSTLWGQDGLLDQGQPLTPIDQKKLAKMMAEEERKHETWGEKGYRTPRAGKAYRTNLFGMKIEVPLRSREYYLAVNLGLQFSHPMIEVPNPFPFFALFYKHHLSENRRQIRAISAGIFNWVEYEDETWNRLGINLLGHFQSRHNPFTPEIFDGRDIEATQLHYGYVRLALGVGWRMAVAPGDPDNDLLVGVYYEPGVQYFWQDSEETSPSYVVPRDTYEHRVRLKVRYDAFERNLLELRQWGWAAGGELTWGRRMKWRDHDLLGQSDGTKTRRYLTFTAYATAAFGIPGLSERHRIIPSVYGGITSDHRIDRYSALPLGGGPTGDESGTLNMPILYGTSLEEFKTSQYIMATLEYRFEILFFLYVHLRGTVGSMRHRALDFGTGRVFLKWNRIGSASVGITSGFVWDSLLYLEYAYNWQAKHDGNRRRNTFLVSWSKEF